MIDCFTFGAEMLALPKELKGRIGSMVLLTGDEHRKVYAVRDSVSGEKMILKWTDAESADDAAQEYAVLSKLSHESIPRVIAFAQENGRDYLLRSYAQGDTLNVLVERDGCFTPRRTAEIAEALCTALAYLHGQDPPIIFKDVKAENIVLTANGKLSLIDFGIAREQHKNKDRDTRLMGSFPYASPEHLGFKDTDPRSDIFSMGRLMAYLCTGDVHGVPADKRLQAIIRKCTRLEPRNRYTKVLHLQRALHHMLNPFTRRDLFLMALTALLIVAGGITAVAYLTKLPPQTKATPAFSDADRREQEENVLLPVLLEVKKGGKPYANCTVSADGTHWYAPGGNGQAMLSVFPFQEHLLRAAEGNRSVVVPAAVVDGKTQNKHSLNLDLAPIAPEMIELSPADLAQPYRLPFEKTDRFEWTRPVDGAGVSRDDQGWHLKLNGDLQTSSCLVLMGKCVNAHGEADVTIVLTKKAADDAPVLIHTAEELNQMRSDLKGCFALANDIDLSGMGSWRPIGDERFPFTGVFDGRGFRIKGLKVQQTSGGCTGLFGKTENALLSSLILEEPDILCNNTAYGGTGALLGWQTGGAVEDCAVLGGRVYADIGYESGVGGVVGLNQHGLLRGLFTDTWVTVAANSCFDKGENLAGGIVGMNSGYITGCGFAGELRGNCIAAGIAGFCDKGIITRCYSAGTIKAKDYLDVFPAGGIAHMLTRSGRISCSAFAEETAAIGASVTRGGVLEHIIPLPLSDIQKGEGLRRALRLGEEDLFVSVPDVSACPLPAGLAGLIAPAGAPY